MGRSDLPGTMFGKIRPSRPMFMGRPDFPGPMFPGRSDLPGELGQGRSNLLGQLVLMLSDLIFRGGSDDPSWFSAVIRLCRTGFVCLLEGSKGSGKGTLVVRRQPSSVGSRLQSGPSSVRTTVGIPDPRPLGPLGHWFDLGFLLDTRGFY